jgi:hypothetical protein
MTSIELSYEDGVADERARIIELIRDFKIADMPSERPGNSLIKVPLEGLVELINGE